MNADPATTDGCIPSTIQCLEQRLAAERDRLRLLLDINNAVVAYLDLRQLCSAIATSLRNTFHQEYTSLALLDSAAREWELHALDFPSGTGLLRQERRVPFSEAPASLAFHERRPVVMRAADLEQQQTEIAGTLFAEGIRCWCGVPLLSRGVVLGTLNLGRTDDVAYTEDELELLTQVAGQIALAVANAIAYRQIDELKNKLAEEKLYLEDEIRTEHQFAEIVGASAALQVVLKQVRIVAPTDSTVLITGETGTGKELIARAIHRLSKRSARTFVKLNCAAIPTGLLESELFGHERGAFTGAIARKIGRFEFAHQGTLFLDEVGDIPLELQAKLLRVLQEQEFERLGATETRRVDVRLVAATNRDLPQMVAERQFRSDLFYRLNVFPIALPPLRDRREDVPLLVRYFVGEHARRLNKSIRSIPLDTLNTLTNYSWPGNVRELENVIERSVLLSPGSELRVATADLKPAVEPAASASTLADAERAHILAVLKQTNWVISGPSGAAARLGMKRTTLQSKMQKLGIVRPTPG